MEQTNRRVGDVDFRKVLEPYHKLMNEPSVFNRKAEQVINQTEAPQQVEQPEQTPPEEFASKPIERIIEKPVECIVEKIIEKPITKTVYVERPRTSDITQTEQRINQDIINSNKPIDKVSILSLLIGGAFGITMAQQAMALTLGLMGKLGTYVYSWMGVYAFWILTSWVLTDIAFNKLRA